MAVDAKTFLVPGKFQEVLGLQILGTVGLLILDFPYPGPMYLVYIPERF